MAGDVHLQFRTLHSQLCRLELLRSFLDAVCRGAVLLGLAVRCFFPVADRIATGGGDNGFGGACGAICQRAVFGIMA